MGSPRTEMISKPAPDDRSPDEGFESGLRRALDIVAVLRSDAARFSFLAMAALSLDGRQRQDALIAAQATLDHIDMALCVLREGRVPDGFAREPIAWLHSVCVRHPARVATIARYLSEARAFLALLDDPAAARRRLDRLIHLGGNAFYTDVTELMRSLWSELDTRRRVAVETGQVALGALDEALSRITQIARAVRLVALNASVEAAHIGQAGRGFALIAQEIRALSDESHSVAQDVRARLRDIRLDE